MPKILTVDPKEVRQSSAIKFTDIPVNAYDKTVKDESNNYSKEEFLRILSDMAAIREFENMLNEIKVKGSYNDFPFTYAGPAHLSAGQEAAAVGQAFVLGVEDYTLGSHRSHGEIIAKGLSSIEQLSDEQLLEVMNNFFDGRNLKIIEENFTLDNVKDKAKYFYIYGAMTEVFARDTGFNRGLGGSMHAFFTPFGIFPNNAIVGGSGPTSTGVALYQRVNKKDGIVVCNIGDASMGCGPVMESLNFAAMDQYRTLWDDGVKGGLPLIFCFNNNSYGMGGQTRGETMAYDFLARMGAGIAKNQMHAERVDGYNPLAVIDAFRRKKEIIKNGDGPVLLDVVTYRISGHSTSDASAYRSAEEIEMWREADSIVWFKNELVLSGICTEQECDNAIETAQRRNREVFGIAQNTEISPYMDLDNNRNIIADLMYKNTSMTRMEERTPDVLTKKEDNARYAGLAKKARYAFDENGKAISKNRIYALRDALFEAIFDKFYDDPTLVLYGEDVRDWGGAFAVTRGMMDSIPYHRLFNAPISEAAIAGSAVGYGMAGGRAIAELMYCDFLGRAGDEVFNQLAKWQSMSAGLLNMPVVLRVSVGSKYGAQHSQDWSALTAHMPGLKVVYPVTPYDAKGLMNSALSGLDPVVFFESQKFYDIGEQFHDGGVPEEYYEIPLGEPDVKRAGTDLTILTIGATLYSALDAAKLFEEHGISVEVIDARSIVPFNYDKVVQSVKKTGRIILASDACARGNILNDFASNITQLCFDYLDAPPFVLGAENWITPAFEFEHMFFPQPQWFLDAYHSRLAPIDGYTPTKDYTDVEMMRKAKLGV